MSSSSEVEGAAVDNKKEKKEVDGNEEASVIKSSMKNDFSTPLKSILPNYDHTLPPKKSFLNRLTPPSFHSSSSSNDSISPLQHEEHQYLNHIKLILSIGGQRYSRTGVGSLSVFGAQMRYTLREDTFPLITTKQVFWRGVAEELLWFVRGSTNANELSEKGIHIWAANSTRGYLSSVELKNGQEGDLGPVYGFQWRHYGARYRGMYTDYNGEGIDQLRQVIDKIRTNPTDRRIIMSSRNPVEIPQMAVPPCHCLAQFYVADGELSCQLFQRAADMGLGVPFNIASYALLTHMIAHVTGLKPGEFVHTLGDSYIYLKHIDALRQQVIREPKPFPTLKFKRNVENIDDFTFEDFLLKDYNPNPKLDMPMVV